MYVSKHRSHIRAFRRCWIRKRFTDSLTDIYMKNEIYIFLNSFIHTKLPLQFAILKHMQWNKFWQWSFLYWCTGHENIMVPLSYRRLKFECCTERGKTWVQHTCDLFHFNLKITENPEISSLFFTVEMRARMPGSTVPVCKLSCSKGMSTTRYQQPPADII